MDGKGAIVGIDGKGAIVGIGAMDGIGAIGAMVGIGAMEGIGAIDGNGAMKCIGAGAPEAAEVPTKPVRVEPLLQVHVAVITSPVCDEDMEHEEGHADGQQ
mmetsp:Transcript_127056/g.367805  ORF Transcript_127056/g.367805 Transcript_127056/m.367805 type:complete len:101 (-) Transcript_127056:76-378(-)